jgi:hypothetical protein
LTRWGCTKPRQRVGSRGKRTDFSCTWKEKRKNDVARQYTVTLLLHLCYTVFTLLLPCCYTDLEGEEEKGEGRGCQAVHKAPRSGRPQHPQARRETAHDGRNGTQPQEGRVCELRVPFEEESGDAPEIGHLKEFYGINLARKKYARLKSLKSCDTWFVEISAPCLHRDLSKTGRFDGALAGRGLAWCFDGVTLV